MAVQGDFMYLSNVKFYFVKIRPLLASLCFLPNSSDPFTVFNRFGDKKHTTNSISSPSEEGRWAPLTAISGALGSAIELTVGDPGQPLALPGLQLFPPKRRGLSSGVHRLGPQELAEDFSEARPHHFTTLGGWPLGPLFKRSTFSSSELGQKQGQELMEKVPRQRKDWLFL